MEEKRKRDDPPSQQFTWKIGNFSKLSTNKLYSETYHVGGYKWRVLIFPKGNGADHLSVYLNVVDSAALPSGWSRYAEFSLSVISHIDNKFTLKKDTGHQFNAQQSDWGFTSFMPFSQLHDPGRGYLVNDTCVIEAFVATFQSADSSFDDMDAYTSKLMSVLETDAPFDSATGGSVKASIPQSTIDEAKKFFIKMLSRDLSEIPDFAAHLTESIRVLSDCCDLTPAQLTELNTLKVEFPTLLKTLTSNNSLKEVEEKMAEKQGTKKSLVEKVKINASAFQMQRAIRKDLIAKEAELQLELVKISEKKKSAEKEIKQLHEKMVILEQSRSSVLEEISTLKTKKKTPENSLSLFQQKWTELRRVFMEPNN